jgi:hypothetical protein
MRSEPSRFHRLGAPQVARCRDYTRSSALIVSPVGPLEPDELLVPAKECRRLHDPNHLTHCFERAPRLDFHLRRQHHQRQFLAPCQTRGAVLLAFADRYLAAQQQNLQVLVTLRLAPQPHQLIRVDPMTVSLPGFSLV